jgi:hypothetical protein
MITSFGWLGMFELSAVGLGDFKNGSKNEKRPHTNHTQNSKT